MNSLYTRTIFLCVLFTLFLAPNIFAQQIIKGQLIDEVTSEPLVGVHILPVGEGNGSISDVSGSFTITIAAGVDSLDISYIGYETQRVRAVADIGIVQLKQSTILLNQLVVSGNREEKERTDIPAALTTVSSQTLEETKAVTLDQVLNKVTGVYMPDLGNEQHMMSIRQPISTKSLFLYLEDGIPIRTMGVFNHNSLIEMNMAALKQVEVIRGPYSSIYGSEAIGGAINFITARPSAVPTVKLSVRGSSLGYKRVDFQASNTLGKTGVLVAGYYGNQKDGYMEHSDFNKLAITAKYNYQISENTSLRGSLTHIGYTTDMTGSLDSTNFYGQQFSSVHTFTNREVNATRFLNTLEHNWSDKSKTTATLILRDNTMRQIPSYRVKDDYSKWANPTGDKNLAHGESNENAFRSIGSVIQHSLFFNKKAASMVAGISIDRSPVEYAANYISIYKSDLGIYESYLLTDSVLTDYQLNITNMAGYVQGEFSPIPKLKLSAALRADAFYYDYLNNLSEIAFSGVPDSKDTFSAITPKLGLTYDLGRTSGVYANWGTGFGPPQVSELYRGVKVPVLVPAVFQNLEGGTWASLFNNKAVLDVAVYRLHGLNEIISVKQDDGTVENKNAGETLHYGVEYSLTIQPVDAINFRFSGTNARHIFVDYVEGGADYTDKIMSGAPPFISNSQLVFQPAKIKGFRAEIEWQHVAPYFMDNNNSDKYEGYDLMNFRLNQRFGDFQLWFQVLNATNTIYATTSSKSKWGKSYNMGNPRNFNLGISYKFNKIK